MILAPTVFAPRVTSPSPSTAGATDLTPCMRSMAARIRSHCSMRLRRVVIFSTSVTALEWPSTSQSGLASGAAASTVT